MQLEKLNTNNLHTFTQLSLELWSECIFEEELLQNASLIDAATAICYLAKLEGNYVGFVHASLRHDYVEGAEELPIAYLEAIYVQPAYQQRGIARQLILQVEVWVREQGVSQIASDTELGNTTSINFHTQIGFEEVNRIVCFVKKI
jgi:aminoglycoside 6'-N-acetyltransferase I